MSANHFLYGRIVTGATENVSFLRTLNVLEGITDYCETSLLIMKM